MRVESCSAGNWTHDTKSNNCDAEEEDPEGAADGITYWLMISLVRQLV